MKIVSDPSSPPIMYLDSDGDISQQAEKAGQIDETSGAAFELLNRINLVGRSLDDDVDHDVSGCVGSCSLGHDRNRRRGRLQRHLE